MKEIPINVTFSALAIVVSALVVVLSLRTEPFQHVDVGGHELRVLVKGDGAPIVILENGLGPPLQIWKHVQDGLADSATIVSYDRAGVAGSDAGPLPRDARAVAAELHTLLGELQLPPPYVLAGYSFGGLYIRTFTGMYPDEVAALVLIDPTPDNAAALASIDDSDNDELNAGAATMLQARESAVPANVPVYLIVAMRTQWPYPIPNPDEFTQERLDTLDTHTHWLDGVANGQLIVTHDSGHTLVFDESDLVVDTIRKAIAESL